MRTLKNSKQQLIIMLSVWSIVMLASVNGSAQTPMKIGYLPILDHLTLVVSHAKDNEAFQNIKIEPKVFKSWEEIVGAIRAGKIDGGYILAPLGMDVFNSGVAIQTILLGHRNGSAITVGKDSTDK